MITASTYGAPNWVDLSTPDIEEATRFYGELFGWSFQSIASNGVYEKGGEPVNNTIKIIGTETDNSAQGYFVYDSKKAGAMTVSHLRFGPEPIHAPYLIQSANFIACHKFDLVNKIEILKNACHGAVLLLNSPYPPGEVWDRLPRPVQGIIIDRGIRLHVIDASRVARNAGMGKRINTVMQACFFALSGVLPRDEAIRQIKGAIEKTYKSKGQAVIDKNFAAVDAALDHLHEVEIPKGRLSEREMDAVVPEFAPDFVREVTAEMMRGHGDELPVSKLPADGTYPSGTTRWEKSNVSDEVPLWREDLCIQCGNCSFVCPHSVIRAKFFHESALNEAPASFASAPISARGFPETRYSLQVYLEDCTGCRLCVEACPVKSPDEPGVRAINMTEKAPILEEGRAGAALVLFCLGSGGVYLINDLVDVERDRNHPVKRNRPIAAGDVSVGTAMAVAKGDRPSISLTARSMAFR